MSLAEDVDLEELIMTKDELSGADIKAVCSELPLLFNSKSNTTDSVAEAGLLALRERRMRVTKVVSPSNPHLSASMTNAQDFTSAKEKVLYRKDENTPAGLYL
jgi:26S proteasome regulatory subunit T2